MTNSQWHGVSNSGVTNDEQCVMAENIIDNIETIGGVAVTYQRNNQCMSIC